ISIRPVGGRFDDAYVWRSACYAHYGGSAIHKMVEIHASDLFDPSFDFSGRNRCCCPHRLELTNAFRGVETPGREWHVQDVETSRYHLKTPTSFATIANFRAKDVVLNS